MNTANLIPAVRALIVAAGVASTAAWAGSTPIDVVRPLDAGGEVRIENISGRIDVEGWDRNEVKVTGKLSKQMKPLQLSGDRGRLLIKVEPRDDVDDDDYLGDTELVVRMPAGASVELHGVSAEISARGLRGRAVAESVSGDVTLEVSSREVEARSVSGDVTVRAPASDASLDSVSGDIDARGLTGRIEAESVSGDIHIEGRDFSRIHAEGVSTDVTLIISLTDDGEVDVETLSGDIEVSLPAAARIQAGSFSGSIDLDESGISAFRGNREFTATDPAGKGSLRLRSFSGDIELRRRHEQD